MKSNLLNYRQYNNTDKNFIYSTYLKSNRNTPYNTILSNQVYFTEMQSILDKLINDTNTKIVICTESSDNIIGYLIYSNFKVPVVHMVYVKYNYRKLGIGKKLLTDHISSNRVFVTTLPKNKSLDSKYIFNPFLLTL